MIIYLSTTTGLRAGGSNTLHIYTQTVHEGKGKSVPLQAWNGPEGSRKFKVPRFHDNGTGRW